MNRLKTALCAGGVALVCAGHSDAETVKAGFNDAEIDWVDFKSGLSVAQADCKPVFILFHTDWCPHCKRYRSAFNEPSIVELSRDFVFVIVDRDYEEATNTRYAPEGGYVPRSVVVNAAGELQTQITGPRSDYKYFLNPDDYRDLEGFLTRAKADFDTARCAFKSS